MIVAIVLLALGLLAGAGWTYYVAINLVPTDIGLVYMQAAATMAATGVLVLALAFATRAITKRLDAAGDDGTPRLAGDRPVGLKVDSLKADKVTPTPGTPDVAKAADDGLPPLAPLSTLEVVRSYESGGTRFTMYSDGSFVSSNEDGEQRFRSLDELRATLGAPKAD
jgi:hypothetical protein